MRWWMLATAGLAMLLSTSYGPVAAQSGADWAIPYGHVFTQTAEPGALGFTVSDDAQARFWTAFEELGGAGAVGYPISRRFAWDGYVTQAFQKLVLQWRPERDAVAFVNVFDELSKAGKDAWLQQERQVPRPGYPSAPGDPWEMVVAKHLALLNENPAIRSAYLGTPGWMDRYGLPVAVGDFGVVRVVRSQRAVFQQWLVDVPWARAGQVVVANGGEVLRDAGLLPVDAQAPDAAAPGRVVLANYFVWYGTGTWNTGCTSDADRPADGMYESGNPEAIARHIAQGRSAGLDGFAVHWFAPRERTDGNFRRVLDRSPEGFNSTVTFLYHILPGVTQQGVIDALRYLIATYRDHPRLFRVSGRPVILFSDMYRVPDAAGQRPVSDKDVATAVARWAEIREAVDPWHTTWWIAEGLQPDYLTVFDGMYVYKIDHGCCPNAFRSAPRWAGRVRDWERRTGQPKLWVGTAMPGWDDLNSAQGHCADLRVSSTPFARDRADGAYYAQTWQAALASRPDFVVVHSFNEWVEGSYVEPSVRFGDQYLTLTAEWATRYKRR